MQQIIKERLKTNQLFLKPMHSHAGKEYVTIQAGIARGERDASTT